jgi:HEAT repeat protein
VSGLKSQSSGPLDYRFVERPLNSGDPEVVEVVREQLEPGSSFCEITLADLDEAFRGLESPQVVIRRHAVSVLGDRSLGGKAAKQILPRLAVRLEDQDASVRRLALFSLAQWKAAARPYRDQMLRLKKDPDREVRIMATYVFE